MEERQRQQNNDIHMLSKTSVPSRYNVFIINDDFTTFEFVIEVLQAVFFKSEAEAIHLAEVTHLSGEAFVGKYTLDIAKSKVSKAVAMARKENFPLRFDIRPENPLTSQI